MFDDCVEHILEVSQEVFGEAVDYFVQGNNPAISVRGIVDRYYTEENEATATIQSYTPVIGVKKDILVSAIGTDPREGDELLIRSIRHIVIEIQPDDRGDMKLILMEV